MSRKEFFLNEVLQVKQTLFQFLRHPVQEIRHVPHWPWARVLGLLVAITAVIGAVTGLIERKLSFSIIAGLFLTPILTLITLSIMSLFFYYCFQIFAERTLSYRHLFTVILFASIPQFVLRVLEGYVPPIAMVGMAFTAFLLMVGFVENFQLPRKLVIRLIAVLYTILLALWLWEQATNSVMVKNWSHDRVEAPEVELGK